MCVAVQKYGGSKGPVAQMAALATLDTEFAIFAGLQGLQAMEMGGKPHLEEPIAGLRIRDHQADARPGTQGGLIALIVFIVHVPIVPIVHMVLVICIALIIRSALVVLVVSYSSYHVTHPAATYYPQSSDTSYTPHFLYFSLYCSVPSL
jgi:hypothetical protein